MQFYTLGRKIVLVTSLLSFITTFLFFTPLKTNEVFFVGGNMFEHVLALAFFGGLATALWGLLGKREYTQYTFSFWDVLFVAVVVLMATDYWYTIVTPHPLLSEQYFI